MERYRALVEATRLVAAGRDLDAVLDALVEQTSRLLDTLGVSLHMAEPGTTRLIRRRRNALTAPGSDADSVGEPMESDAFIMEAIARRGPLFTCDFQGDPRVRQAAKASFPSVRASVAVPLFADDELVGALFAHWDRRHEADAEELELVEALGQHAAIAIRSARLLDEARRARREQEALFEAAGDGIMVITARGDFVAANDRARTWLANRLGRMPTTVEGFRELARPLLADGSGDADTPLAVERALAGEVATEELVVQDVDGTRRHLHVSAAPIRGEDGRVVAAVVIARDITALRRSIQETARLDGAVKTARRVGHELSNQLALVAGYGELLAGMADGPTADMALRVHDAAMKAGTVMQLMQRIIRFEETEFGGQVMLDLERATRR
jgi:PAS domain S-box-containing protein